MSKYIGGYSMKMINMSKLIILGIFVFSSVQNHAVGNEIIQRQLNIGSFITNATHQLINNISNHSKTMLACTSAVLVGGLAYRYIKSNSFKQRCSGSLLWAARNGHSKIAQLLISWCGANVNTQDNLDATPLMLAARNNHQEVAQYLMTKCDIDNLNRTLLWAAQHGHAQAVKSLLHCGAKVNTRNHQGKTPLMLATRNEHSEVVRHLIDYDDANATMLIPLSKEVLELAKMGLACFVDSSQQEAFRNININKIIIYCID